MTVCKSQDPQIPDILVELRHKNDPVVGRELFHAVIIRTTVRHSGLT